MADSYIQVPPDSTGKKIASEAITEIYIDNFTEGSIALGDILFGGTSNATGKVTGVVLEGSGEAKIYLKDASGTWLDNEAVEVNAVIVGNVNWTGHSQLDAEYQKILIADPNNPSYIQSIDRFGATVNTFTDGAPTFSPFGAMVTGERQNIKAYSFDYDNMDQDFTTVIAGAGTATFEPITGCSLVTTGTAPGDLAQRTTDFYHPYKPGVGQQFLVTVQVGDNGKTNVVRRWGYYDDDNGVFWELDGTQLSVVLRSNTTGVVTETRINQQDFHLDQLDGTDSIGFNLDLTKSNIFLIDLQWLGSGRVRFGVSEPEGSFIIAHIMENANVNTVLPYMRTASLPFRYEQENTGVAVSGSEMKIACATVNHSSKVYITGPKFSTNSNIKTLSVLNQEEPLYSFRPATTFAGQTNRCLSKGVSNNFANLSGDGVVLFRLYFAGSDATLTNQAFAAHAANSSTEIDTAATAFNPALAQCAATMIVAPGETIYVVDPAPKDLHTFELYLGADGTTQPTVTVTAELISGTTADVMGTVNWEEIRS